MSKERAKGIDLRQWCEHDDLTKDCAQCVSATLAAKDAELARLRGVVEAAARSFRLIAAQAKLRETWGISLDNIEIEAAYQERQAHLASIPSPAEAGEDYCNNPSHWGNNGGCADCGKKLKLGEVKPAAPSDARAGERPCEKCGGVGEVQVACRNGEACSMKKEPHFMRCPSCQPAAKPEMKEERK
jgi:hypothetical protein